MAGDTVAATPMEKPTQGQAQWVAARTCISAVALLFFTKPMSVTEAPTLAEEYLDLSQAKSLHHRDRGQSGSSREQHVA